MNYIDPLGLDVECHADPNSPGGVTCTVTVSASYPPGTGGPVDPTQFGPGSLGGIGGAGGIHAPLLDALGGGGGDDPIGAALKRLKDLLKDDPKCLAFLNSKGLNALDMLNGILQFKLYGETAMLPTKDPNGTWTMTNAVSFAYPEQAITRYGNRKSQSPPPNNSVTVDPNTNRLLDPGYAYDAAGNMTKDGVNTLVYDGENRVVQLKDTPGTNVLANYTLDGNSLRVKKQVTAGATTIYIFSGTKVIAEYDNGAAVASPSREYIYSGSTLVAKIEAGTATYQHPDHLSTRVTTDTSGRMRFPQVFHSPFLSVTSSGTDTGVRTCYLAP